MVSEPDTGRCASEDVVPHKRVQTRFKTVSLMVRDIGLSRARPPPQ